MTNEPTRTVLTVRTKARCQECGRVFDLMEDVDAEEWHYGHECEA